MDDLERVTELLGRRPRGSFEVVVRDPDGDPVVVRNAPFLDDGTPMPTRYYLVGANLVRDVSRIEAAGGVNRAEAELPADAIAATHERYAAERSQAIPADHDGPRPFGGVGGTRVGVKCLHAHVAHLLATGDDVVGSWTLDQIELATGRAYPRPGPLMAPANEDPGGLTVTIDDASVEIAMTGGARHAMPVGPRTIGANEFERRDPPPPACLTNALGIVLDHLDDMLIESPIIGAAPSIVFVGHHTASLAHVEFGGDALPAGYLATRDDIEEVFRTMVAEAPQERRANPGLDDEHVGTIVATCCVVLAIMRRLALGEARFVEHEPSGRGSARPATPTDPRHEEAN
jgi:hypothetical protein